MCFFLLSLFFLLNCKISQITWTLILFLLYVILMMFQSNGNRFLSVIASPTCVIIANLADANELRICIHRIGFLTNALSGRVIIPRTVKWSSRIIVRKRSRYRIDNVSVLSQNVAWCSSAAFTSVDDLRRYYRAERGVAVRDDEWVEKKGERERSRDVAIKIFMEIPVRETHGKRITYMDASRQAARSRGNESNEIVPRNGYR